MSMNSPAAPAATSQKFRVTGMTCQGCVRAARQAIEAVAGVAGAAVDLNDHSATVRWAPGATPNAQAVVDALRADAGFEASLQDAAQPAAAPRPWSPLEGWRFNVVVGAIATVPLMLGEWVLGVGMERWFQWLAFALALPVQVVCGARFYRGAWNQLRAGGANMDTLVALGSTVAFAYSAFGLFAGWRAHLYFMEAASIITLISVGHWLEARASDRAAGALKSLLNLAPPTARWLSGAGVETEVPVANLAIGDRVLLKPGDRVPTDGDCEEGQSAVDEAMLTGESLPVEKAAGAKLYAGTVNLDGRLVLRVTATGEATALAQIIAIVERAQNSRAAIQRLADRVSAVFVPVVVLLALATAAWWGFAFDHARAFSQSLMPWLWHAHLPGTPLGAAVVHAAAVLIVACPCAMGLATPIAIMVGANVASRRGILIRDGQALEKSGRLTAVVFDKTGTLTRGKVEVAAVEDAGGATDLAASTRAMAAALAAGSNHPLSQAIARWGGTPSSPATLTHWTELRGLGVQADSAEGPLRLGSLAWLRESGVQTGPLPKFADNWAAKGATVVGLAAGAQLLGLFALRDTLKPHAEQVVRALAAQGRKTFLVTGDHARTAAVVAQLAGIPREHVLAEARPEQKAAFLERLQQGGERVAFVGDGINDAPALKQADLGIVVSRASDVAREAADVILLRSDIEAIPEAIGLAQATLRTIRQNLFWAFFYNAAAIPLAATGFLSPIVCAAAMGLSDLLVIGNALRLRRWRLKG